MKSGAIGRYDLSGGPFNRFKIVQTGPCLGPDDDYKYRMRIIYLDFFGHITNTYKNLRERKCRSSKTFSFTISLFLISI